jgi:PAS domain S-box-containing protein
MYCVLYVDDEPSLLHVGKIFLERSGALQVDTACSAAEAIEQLKLKNYDVVICDYQMPEMNGITFLKYVKTRYNLLPFILFTGKGREEVAIDAINNGADFYVQKGGDTKSQFIELEHKIRLAVERRKTAADLAESRQRMNDIIDHLPDATFAIDLRGNVIAWNRAMEEMTGVRNEEILGTGNHSYAIPFYGEPRPVLLDLILKDNKELSDSYPFVARKDNKLVSEIFIQRMHGGKGSYLWFIASPLYDSQGTISGAIESIRDITDRKQAEDELNAAYQQIAATEEELRGQFEEIIQSNTALRESEERYRTLVETTDTGFVVLNEQGVVLDTNRRYVEMTGHLDNREILGRNVTEWTAEYDKEKNRQAVTQCIRDGVLRNFEVNYVDKSGSVTPVEINATVISSGGSPRIITLCRDITRRKHAETIIMENQRTLEEIVHTYRTIFENTGTAMVLLEEDTTISLANAEFERLSGYPRDAIEGKKHWTEFVLAEDLDRMIVQHRLRRERKEAALTHYEFRFVSRSGGMRNIFLIIDLIPGTKRSVASLIDITDKIRAQERLKGVNDKLRLLNRITRHDIRNQLTSLKGYLELAGLNFGDPGAFRCIEKGKTVAGIIGEQIEFTADYEDIGISEPQWQDLDRIMPRSAVPGDVEFLSAITGIEVYADRMLVKVFYNLIDNSVRHGENVRVIRVSSRDSFEGLLIVYEDDGIGIPKNAREEIFVPGHGTQRGLGMFLSREILAITGITIRENGTEGKGVRFEINVPKGAYRIAR